MRIGGFDRRPRLRPSQVLAHMARPMRPRAVEISSLTLDPDAHAAGYADARDGRSWNGTAHGDVIAYSRGYVDGARVRRESL
jgi:hypothetical protein